MKSLRYAALLVLALGAPAYAQTHPTTVGHPFGKAKASSPAAVSTSGVSLTGDPLKDLLTQIEGGKDKIIADLNQALTTQAAVINPSTGSAWDPDSVLCLGGVPAIGTQGQPGYVAPTPGLIAWISGLTAPAVSAVPPLPDSPSAATLAVHARLLLMAANSDVGAVLNQVNTTGVPSNLKTACGAVVQDTVTAGGNLVSQGAAFAALLGKFVAIAPIK